MRHRLRETNEEGFTLIEVVVALVLFGLLVSSVAVALTSTLKKVRVNQNRVVAANIGTRVIDRLHAIPASQLPTGALPTQTVVSGSTSFTVSSRVAVIAGGTGATASACDGGGALSAKSVHVEITWSGMGSTKPVVTDTLRQLTVSELDLTKGSLSLAVVDRNGAAVAGQQLTLAPGSRTAVTEADGCAVFSSVPAGTYTVALVARDGWVEPLGAATAAHTVTITGGDLIRDAGFRFDRSATVQTRWTGPVLTTYPVLSATGVTLSNAEFTSGVRPYSVCGTSPCTTGYPASSAAQGGSISGLFPFADGYRVWAGICSDARPSSLPGAVIPAPGATASINVAVAPVAVTVQDRNGNGKTNQSVTLTHVGDATCATSQVIPATGSNPARFSLPAGSWSFSSGGGAAVTAAVQPGAAVQTITVRQS